MNKNYVVKTIILLMKVIPACPCNSHIWLACPGQVSDFFNQVVCRPLAWALVHQASENKVTCQAGKSTGPG